ncbi:MAG TPA: hypothetical protein VLB73_01255 [Patescibacteria group bacterium]|nr:hypothetical protein [Patescibacteria group bacterium]
MKKDQIILTHFAVAIDGEVVVLHGHDKGNSTKNAQRAKTGAQKLRDRGRNAYDVFINDAHAGSSTSGVYRLRGEGLFAHGLPRRMRNAAGIYGDGLKH